MPALTQKGQVTVPRDVRRLLGLNTGDEVRFVVMSGRVEVQKAVHDHRSSYGLLSAALPEKATSVDEESDLMDALIEDDDRTRGRSR